MANQIVSGDHWLATMAARAQALLNTGTWKIKLFTNNHTPLSADAIAAFTEGAWDTYANITIGAADFGTPAQITSGEYQTQSPIYTFAAPIASGTQTVYGWWIDDGANVQLAFLFNAPVSLTNGGPSLGVQVQYQEWAKSIL